MQKLEAQDGRRPHGRAARSVPCKRSSWPGNYSIKSIVVIDFIDNWRRLHPLLHTDRRRKYPLNILFAKAYGNRYKFKATGSVHRLAVRRTRRFPGAEWFLSSRCSRPTWYTISGRAEKACPGRILAVNTPIDHEDSSFEGASERPQPHSWGRSGVVIARGHTAEAGC